MALVSDVQKLSVINLITLYELDATPLGGEIYRFHGHQGGGVISWHGQQYTPISITTEGLEMRGDGKASMPKLRISNRLGDLQGAISAFCLRFADFAGAKLTIITTTDRYLDGQSDEYKKQVWIIEQKTDEDEREVVFELSNLVDFENWQLPGREVNSFCNWAVCGRYRGEECGYIGTKMFTANGNPTDNRMFDVCPGRLSDCKLRGNEGSFGGYPASSLV